MTSVGGGFVSDIIATRPRPSVSAGNNDPQLIPVRTKEPCRKLSLKPSISSGDGADYPEPTEEEQKSLRLVPARLPFVAYSLCLVEFAERASYYGAKTVFSNFIQFPLPAGGNGAGAPPRHTQKTAGALGMGLQAASGLTLLFQFLAYVMPVFGGWIADVKIGRYRAIVYGVLLAGVAHIIQIVGAIPSVLQKGSAHSAPPFILGLILLAFGAGLFKPNIAPTIMDQHRHDRQYTKVLKSGEKVIVDPETTNTRTMLIFYALTNVGAFFMVATTYSEKYIGFWLSFLEVGAIYFLLPILLALIYKRTYRQPPNGGKELTEAFKITFTALRRNKFQFWRKDFWDVVRPSFLTQKGADTSGITWSDKAVEDVRRTVSACEIFCYYPIWLLNDGGIGSVSSNQGASMITNGAPNDLLNNFNPLTIIITVPILSYVIYPTLAKFGLSPGRVTRITFGFFLATVGGLCGTLVQWRVYSTSPCGYQASTCEIGVSPLSIWWQIPNNVFSAWSEIFCNVTAYEIAYARSPPHRKGLVTSIFLFMNALSAAIGEILIPATKDPWLIWIWAAPTIALAVQSVFFWFRFKHLNDDKYMISEKDFKESDDETEISKDYENVEKDGQVSV